MEVQVFRTPKIIVNKCKKNPLLRHNESPIKLKRRLSLANSRTNLFKNNDLVTKRCENSKKPIINILPKESNQKEVKNNIINEYKKIEAKSGKINRINEIHNNFFINLTKNIYTNESHLKKKIVRNSQKFLQSSKNKFAIDKNPNNSKNGLFNRRLSCIILPSSFEKKRRNIDNKNLEKEAVTEYSNFKSSKRQKYNENISKLLLNKNLTKKEKEFMLDYLNNIKEKDLDSSPKFKLEDRRSISPRKKKNKKKNNVKFNDKHSHLKKEKEVNDKNEELEKEITEKELTKKELTENNINNKIIFQNKNPNFLKMICFKPFFCCLKMNK